MNYDIEEEKKLYIIYQSNKFTVPERPNYVKSEQEEFLERCYRRADSIMFGWKEDIGERIYLKNGKSLFVPFYTFENEKFTEREKEKDFDERVRKTRDENKDCLF